jgi:hypothetical protein
VPPRCLPSLFYLTRVALIEGFGSQFLPHSPRARGIPATFLCCFSFFLANLGRWGACDLGIGSASGRPGKFSSCGSGPSVLVVFGVAGCFTGS